MRPVKTVISYSLVSISFMIWLFSLALYMYTLTARILVLIWFDLFFYKGQTTVIMFILNCSLEVWKRNTYFGTDQNIYQKMITFLCLGTI